MNLPALFYAPWRYLILPLLLLPVVTMALPDPRDVLSADSLKQVMKEQSGRKKVNTLNRLSWEIMYSDTRGALSYAMEALTEARAAGYPRGEYVAHNLAGIAFDVFSRYDSALIHYHAALNGSLAARDTQSIASNLTNIALAHWHIGNYKEALEYNFEALPYFEKLNDADDLASVNNNIGLIYADLKSWDKASEFYRKAYDLHKRAGNKIGLGATLNNIGKLYYYRNNFTAALAYLDSAEVMKTGTGDKYGLAIVYKDLGMLYAATGELVLAAQMMEKSMFFAREVDDRNELAAAQLELAKIMLSQGKTAASLALTRSAGEVAHEISSRKLLYQVYENLSMIYERQGDMKQALDFYKLFKATEDSVVSDQRLNQVYELEMKHQAEKSADKIALLTRQQEIQKLQIGRRNMFIFFSLVFFLASLVVIYFIYQNYRHKQKILLDNALYHERERKAREVIEAEIRERKRIGEELHDGFGQILSMIKLRLTSISSKDDLGADKNREMIADVVALADQAFTELRTISHDMAPILLKEKGLTAALRDLLDRVSKARNYRVLYDTEGIGSGLDPFIENTVYRIVQEILNNIMKHAEATEINLQLISDGNDLTLVAEDNGRGFDPSEAGTWKGIGLKNLHSRAENLNGHVLIDTAPNRGTIITVIIPLRGIQDGNRS